jgi:hypothetical protein
MLSDAHLGAEYRELPRVFGLVRKAIGRGLTPADIRMPERYVLGKGHIRFFYDKLDYLADRYLKICHECRCRGRVVNYGDVSALSEGIPGDWFNYWEASPKDMALNIDRINAQGGLRPGFVFPVDLIVWYLDFNQ